MMENLRKYWVIVLLCTLLLVLSVSGIAYFATRESDQQNPAKSNGDLDDRVSRDDRSEDSDAEVSQEFDEDNPPKIIEAHYIDLDKVGAISKFRSDAGHDFSDQTSPCSSMKHYFDFPEGQRLEINGVDLPPTPTVENGEPIYSPIDGIITRIEEEQFPLGKQIYIQSSENSLINVRLFHIYPLDDLEVGMDVTSGTQIGLISAGQSSDIAVEVYVDERRFYSIFELMSDQLFADYVERGIVSPQEFILSEEYRIQNPLECQGETFVREDGYDSRKEWREF